MGFNSVDEILDFAIRKEEEAADYYTRLADKFAPAGMKSTFLDFAREEQGHKGRLLAVKRDKAILSAEKKILDLKIGDDLVEVDVTDGVIDYQSALIVAMKAEKAAYKLYTDLASVIDDPALKETLLGLAQEEAKHKLKFEIEYDERILKDN
jgi:rubrerythrin